MFRLVRNHLRNSFSTVKETPVLFEYHNNAAKVILNKPKALNALDLEMIRILQKEINKWGSGQDVKLAIFKGAGDKAFCAGGDIKTLYESKTDSSKAGAPDAFFREEYTLDYTIANMKTIQVALLDGIVMGGGVGISVHAPIRVATETSTFAMPEAKIGLFTDVAGGYFLARLRNNLGYFLGLTGQRLKGHELVQCGIADYFVKRDKLSSLESDLIELSKNQQINVQDAKKVVEKYTEKVELKYPNEEFIKEHFGKATIHEIYDSLKNAAQSNEMASKLVKQMDSQSPMSMAIIHEQIKRGGNINLAENFKMDLRLATRFMEGRDFFEGVRCTLIDKKDNPKWEHKSLSEVKRSDVEKYFEKISKELVL